MQVLRLANEDQSVTVDLMRGPIGLRDGWDTSTPAMGGAFTYEPYGAQFSFDNFQPVSESFDLAIVGPGASVRKALDDLQDFLEMIRLFNSGDLAAAACWLEWSAEGEPNKRSLLYSGSFKAISDGSITPSMPNCQVLGRLSLTRHPLWEAVTYGEFSPHELSTLGGKYDYAGIPGNTLARIENMGVFEHTIAGNLARLWIGFRPINQGVTNFYPLWECEDGTNGTDAADVADATASGGNKVRVTYVTLTLVSRMTITCAQVWNVHASANTHHAQGRYLVLLRCKVSAAGTSGIQMRWGYTGNNLCEEVYIDNTAWRLIPLGEISIPPWEGAEWGMARYMDTFRLDLYAEQLTAGHNLDLDCLVLIPSEHLVASDGGSVGAASRYDIFHTMQDDKEVAIEYDSALVQVYDTLEVGFTDWYLPQGSGTIIVAGEGSAAHALGDTVNLYIAYFSRWLLYRMV